jgi:hypothetical protein
MPYHHELTMSEETASQPQIKISWLIGVLAAFAIFSAIGNYSARMTSTYTDYDEQRAEQRKVTLAKVQQAENKLLDPVDKQGKPSAEWVDQDKGLVRIPIDEAMSREIDTLKAEPPAMGSDLAPAAPAAAPAPTSGATNAAPAAASAPASTSTAPTAGATNAASAKPAKPKEAKK